MQKMSRWKKSSLDQDRQRELKTGALYRVASAAFRRNGYHGTSLVDIANDLGVSKPTLYYYVDNKQDLLYQCHLAAAEQAIASVCSDRSRSGLERLRETLRSYIEAIICPESFSVVILEERSLSDDQLRAVIARRDIFDSLVRSVIEQGIADGSIRHCEPKMALFAALGAANWVTKWYRPEGVWSVQEIATGMANLICNGLAVEDALPSAASL